MNDFDRDFNRAKTAFGCMWIVSALLSIVFTLAVIGLIIAGIIFLVG